MGTSLGFRSFLTVNGFGNGQLAAATWQDASSVHHLVSSCFSCFLVL